ncbi:acyl carrier protein [Kitasatospora sp. NBC_00085]|uniref:acyl carrier protein n=1 Tax=unclassified Kitasatospora TaxID=2633591 RepID=UPI00324B7E70
MTTEHTPTAVEETLRELFAQVLELDGRQISLDDDFFSLGGHSQLAIRLAALARKRLGVKVAVADVFSAPTVAGLALCAAQAAPVTPLTRRTAEDTAA